MSRDKTYDPKLVEQKLSIIAEVEGYDSIEEYLEENHTDSVITAVCMNPDCDYTEGMEPDQTEGWCPECEAGTLVSPMILMGIV